MILFSIVFIAFFLFPSLSYPMDISNPLSPPELGPSPRSAGRGGASIVETDIEGDPFINPAKGSRVENEFAFAYPTIVYYRNRNTYLYEYRYNSYNDGSSATYLDETISPSIPIGGFYRIKDFFFGGSIGYTGSFISHEYNWTNSSIVGAYAFKGSISDKISLNGLDASLIAGYRYSILSIGLLGKTSNFIGTNTINDKNSRDIHSKYDLKEGMDAISTGLLLNAGEARDISAVFSINSLETKSNPKSYTINSMPQDLRYLLSDKEKGKGYDLIIEFRQGLAEEFTVGARAGYAYFSSKPRTDSSYWNSEGKRWHRAYIFGLGMSWHPGSWSIIASDLIFSPFIMEWKDLSRGNYLPSPSKSNTEENGLKILLRTGIEGPVSDNFLLRAGVILNWNKTEFTSSYRSSDSAYTYYRSYTGLHANTMALTTGASYVISRVRIDLMVRLDNKTSCSALTTTEQFGIVTFF